jgi:RHS repeat-associated protein
VFGALRSGSPAATDFLFTGEQLDSESSFYYLRARYYDPAIGRFLSQDPLPSGNLYTYVRNNPVNFSDPYGLHCKAWHPHHCVKEAAEEATEFVSETVPRAADWAWERITDPYNIATAVQFASGWVATVSCRAPAGVVLAVCVVSATIYVGATAAKAEIICQQVNAGQYSASEGFAKQVVGLFPIPSGIAGGIAKRGLNPLVSKIVHKDPGICISDRLASASGDQAGGKE